MFFPISPIMFLHFVIGATAANAWLTDASEVCDGQCPEAGSPGSVLLQTGKHSAVLRSLEAPGEATNTYLGTDLDSWLMNKMIMPDPWKCAFYNGDWRVCEKDVAQAGLVPGMVTEAGRKTHEYVNIPRVHMSVGAMPCCPTSPFCSSPKCSDSFLATRASALPAVCTKHSGDYNFLYMIGQHEWPAYFAYCGGYSFDVHKHWDVLNRVIGCPLDDPTCPWAMTFDLVIDLGSNFGMVTEELTNRHFAKSYILVDAAPFAGQDFNRRLGNETWRKVWYDEQIPKRQFDVVPNYEFHEYGLAMPNIEGKIDLCTQWGYGDGPCPVENASPDTIIPGRLSDDFQLRFQQAQSAFVKIDVEGYDHLALLGMRNLLQETRGAYPDGSQRHLINFMMLEYAPWMMDRTKEKEGLVGDYNLKNITSYLEFLGFEVFLTGPRYLPLTHGSWDDQFLEWFEPLKQGNTAAGNPMPPHCPTGTMYPRFKELACPGPLCDCTFATDLFAMRASHPKAAEIKVALGACKESKDFDPADPQYNMSQAGNP